jgi:hypothetical protein
MFIGHWLWVCCHSCSSDGVFEHLPKMQAVETPEEAWGRLQNGVEKILKPSPTDPLSPKDFMECYT